MVVEGVEYLRVNILKLLVGAYLRFRLEGWVPMGWSALNPERLLLSSLVGNQVTTFVPFYSLNTELSIKWQ